MVEHNTIHSDLIESRETDGGHGRVKREHPQVTSLGPISTSSIGQILRITERSASAALDVDGVAVDKADRCVGEDVGAVARVNVDVVRGVAEVGIPDLSGDGIEAAR